MLSFLQKSGVQLPTAPSDISMTAFDFFVDNAGNWKSWKSLVSDARSPLVPSGGDEFWSVHVATQETARAEYMVDVFQRQGLAVLIVGDTGAGRSTIVQHYLSRQDPELVKTKVIPFSYATSPLMLQKTLESAVEKRMGNSYGPPPGKRMIVFLDDVGMPEVNRWGDQVGLSRSVVSGGPWHSWQFS